MIKSVRKIDLEKLLAEEISNCLKLEQSDFELSVNSIYAEVKILGKALPYEKFCGDGSITDKGYKRDFSNHLENLTNSNVGIAFYYPLAIDNDIFISRIQFAIKYQIN